MILGVAPTAIATGWALLDEAAFSFVDLGVAPSREIHGSAITLDRARLANTQADVLATKLPGCSLIVVERPDANAPADLALSIGLAWGVLLGIVATIDPAPRLLTIAPMRWQREVLPAGADTEVDYQLLATRAGEFVLGRHPRAAKALRRVPEPDRDPAIAAAMLALMGAILPDRCEAVRAGAT